MAETTPTEPTETEETDLSDDELGDAGKRALDQERKQRRDAEKRVKATEAELVKLRQQTMTDQEKAVEAARSEGKTEALKMLGSAKVESAFAIAANGRIETDSLRILLQGLNHTAFLSDDGTVDEDSVATFIDGIAPKPDPNRRVDLGQGARPGGKHGPGGSQSADPLTNALTALTKR